MADIRHIRQKQGCNTNPNVAQFIAGLKHICAQKAFKLSEKANVQQDDSELLQGLPFSQNSSSLLDNVEHAEPDCFPSGDDISILAQDIKSNIIDDSAAYYVSGFLVKMFLEKSLPDCSCAELLKDHNDTLAGPHQYFRMLKAYHVPSKVFGNLTVPSQRAFEYVKLLNTHFLAMIESTANLPGVCSVLYCTFVTNREHGFLFG